VEQTHRIDQTGQLKALTDPHRVEILRLIMAEPATLSQLGAALDRHPAWIRHHVKQLEGAELVELVESRKVGGYVEKYYGATAKAFAVNLMIFPQPAERDVIVVLGSDDLALQLLASDLHDDPSAPDVFRLPMGSLEGLIALRQGLGHVAGCHLLDPESGDFNVPYARHIFPGRSFAVVTLAHRQQGLLLQKGNPRHIRSIPQAVEMGARLVNRNPGSGTRVWLDRLLHDSAIVPESVPGYADEVFTHGEVALSVAEGRADVGLGLRAVALAQGLAFVPLFEERFDLVIPAEHRHTPLVVPLFERLASPAFKETIEALGGYNAQHTGEEVLVAA
jgi:putative molybdopterin biosynthesis protein